MATVPLQANDQSIGVLFVGDATHGRRFTEEEVTLLTAFADQASLVLGKARLLNEAETESYWTVISNSPSTPFKEATISSSSASCGTVIFSRPSASVEPTISSLT